MNKTIINILVSFFVLSSTQIQAESVDSTDNWAFHNSFANTASWGKPFWADMHSSITKAEVSYATNRSEYNYGENKGLLRPFVFSNLGVDIPVWANDFGNKNYGFGITLPFFIDVWMDFFERSTAPVINTSYRFGLPDFSFIYRKKISFINNFVIRLSPFKHECSHIGDELLLKREEWKLPIKRVNVSYNYSEFQLTINDPDNTVESNHSIKTAFMMIHNLQDGWYTVNEQEADVEIVNQSTSHFEYYFQYQYQTEVFKNNFQGIISTEIRNRAVYKYPTYGGQAIDEVLEYTWDDDRRWCYNAIIGLRYNNPKRTGLFSKIGLGLRAYRGLNPHGQFRSILNYEQVGFVLIFE